MNTSDSKEYNHLKRNFWIILITVNLVFIVTAFLAGFSKKDYSVNQKQNACLIGASYMTMNNDYNAGKLVGDYFSTKNKTARLVIMTHETTKSGQEQV